jgi:hypothetical protein
MLGECNDCARPWIRFAYNNNPFYAISAALVLYGLHVSFADSLDPTEGWTFTQLLIGYMLLLGATSVAIVRLGQVWEDARTLVLLVSLLMIALASSFDRVCLDNAEQGARFLVSGLGCSLLISEMLIRFLRLRFPWKYRLPFYLLLGLLFAYPIWLGHLSLQSRNEEMSWYVLGFPMIAAVLFTTLVPASRRRGQDVVNNGTPWGWPLYPWSLFVLVGVGVLLRAYAMSMSFDPTKGSAIGFQPYFVIPLILSWLLLWTEGADQSKPGRRVFAVLAPLVLVLLAFPGTSANLSQALYIAMLHDSIGSPIQITAALLIAYFTYLRLRGIRLAEAGILVCIGILAIVDRSTVNLETLATIHVAPIVVGVALLVITGLWYGSAVRMGIASLVVIAAISYSLRGTDFLAFHGYIPVHLAFFALILLGLCFHDWLGRTIAQAAPYILTVLSVVALMGYRFAFPEFPPAGNGALALVLAITAAAYWMKNRRFIDLVATTTCLAISLALFAEQVIGNWLGHLVMHGRHWIALGAIFFLVALAISLAKGGQARQLRRALMRLHLALQGSNRQT